MSAVSRNPNHIDVFWAGPDGTITVMWWDTAPGGKWTDHAPVPISPAGVIGSDVATVIETASGLLAESAQAAGAGKTAEAVDAAQQAVSVLERAAVTADRRLDYLIMRAEALHTLVLRLIAAGRIPEAVAPASLAMTAYVSLAAVSDVHPVVVSLQNLSQALTSAGLDAAALDAEQAAMRLTAE